MTDKIPSGEMEVGGPKWEYALESVTFSTQHRKKNLKINFIYKNRIDKSCKKKLVSVGNFVKIISFWWHS